VLIKASAKELGIRVRSPEPQSPRLRSRLSCSKGRGKNQLAINVYVYRFIPAIRSHPDFSIRLIEILNSTFDPKWL
jgi:hypothetical protein